MPWLISRNLPTEAGKQLEHYIGALAEQFDDPLLDRNITVRDTLAEIMHGTSYSELSERAPMAAFAQEAEKGTVLTTYGAGWLGGAIGAGLAIIGGAAGLGRGHLGRAPRDAHGR
mgnify:CR=1 FL=1